MASPIRVGIIGLGKGKGDLVPGLWAAKAHLPYLLASPHYKITAVSNSTTASAQASIDYHNLGPSVKAYGSPTDLAADPNVDLIVVSVRVASHYALTKPAIKAGKDVFVEWPLGATTAEAVELTKLAEEKGVKTIVGLQARASPLVVKIKSLIDEGKIGKVLSSTVVGIFSGLPTSIWIEGAEYYLDLNSGGNALTIFFGHFLDSFNHVLGPFASLTSILHTEYKTLDILSPTGAVVNPSYPKTTPDHVFLQGHLASGALGSITYRVVPDPDKSIGGIGLRWIITGDEGEIEITTPDGQWQSQGAGVKVVARLGKGAKEEVIFDGVCQTAQEGKEKKWVTGVENTGELYEAFVKGEMDKYPDFKEAVQTHKTLDLIREGGGVFKQ